MQRNSVSSFELAVKNVKRKPLRTIGLSLLVALLSFVLFGGTILSVSLNIGLDSVKNRLGADLMVVPLGYDEKTEGILIKGEPSYFYFDKSIEEKLKELEGVDVTSAQFFLTSTNQDCCDIPVQFIGFDSATDFSVTPWISEVYDGDVEKGDLIVGNDIEVDGSSTLKFFDKEYKVAAKLDETGTGLDQAVYANMDTLYDLFGAAKAKGMGFTENVDPENSISTVLVKIKDGYDVDTVVHNIRTSLDSIQIVKTKSMTTDIAEKLDGFLFIIYFMVAMLFIMAIITLAVVFTVTANERKREFGIIRASGASKGFTASIVLNEALIISTIGAVSGTALSAVIVFSFSTYIGDTLSLPYLQPSLPAVLLILAVSLFVSVITAPIASFYSAIKISNAQTFLIMREGD